MSLRTTVTAAWETQSTDTGSRAWPRPDEPARSEQTRAGRSHDERRPEPRPAPWQRSQPPGRTSTGNRLLITLLFWFALAASVELWWVNTEPVSLTDRVGLLVAAGRITGMASGFVLLAEVAMMSRLPLFESWVGAHDLMRWHRVLGAVLVVLVPAHAVLLVFGYAAAAKASVTQQTVTMLTTLEDMVSATIATGVLVVAGLLAARVFRRWLPYELWHTLHLSLYLVIPLGYGHQFALGAQVLRPGFARWYWIVLHALVGVCLFWGRVLRPLWLNLRHGFRVTDVVPESRDWVSLYIGGRRLDRVPVKAGQYFRWRFLARGCWWQAHPFSISAAPNGEWLRVTVKAVGRYTRDLYDLEPGARVVLSGPSGSFTPDRRMCDKALLIAGGGGIAPIMSLLEELPPGTMLIYRAGSEGELVFREELEDLARDRGAQVYFVLGSRNDHWPRRVLTPDGLRELVPDVTERDVYLCGPKGLVKASVSSLRRLGVARRQIHLDPFEF